ncbi:GAF domain-containing protein, partial [Cellulomonas endophytica]|uniref:GAF domain-containing protein n=1 Tax=Cellulomonas endophytica TaxID=2494735 RepID=UPI0013E98532
MEALERVLLAFEGGVADAQDARVKLTDALVETLGLTYGARWVPAPDGQLELAYETGRLGDRLRSAVGGATRLQPDAGLVGQAARRREPVLVTGDVSAARSGCLRWQAATQAGMVAGAAVPMMDEGDLVGVMEFYSDHDLPRFDDEKWRAISRIATLARRQALTATALQETLDDREAVTTVVTQVGEAKDEATALRVALETVRTAFGWAYGSFWA